MGTDRKNRVLCVTSNYPRWPGDSTTPFVHSLCQDLQSLGWEINVLAPHAKGTANQEVIDDVLVNRFRYLWPDHLETVCYRGGALANLRKSPSNYLKLPALIISEFAHIIKYVSFNKYDLIHSHWILPQGFTGGLASRLLKVPHVVTVHGSDVFSLNTNILNACKAFALRCAETVTANSSATAKEVSKIYPHIKHLAQIPMGVKTAPPHINKKVLLKTKEKYLNKQPLLLFVGRIVKEKGIGELLQAVAILRKDYPSLRLLIIGEGQDRERFEEMTHCLFLDDNVTFTGWIPSEKIPQFFHSGGIYVGPSWTEGQGLSIMEAMVENIPVIGTRVGGIPDFIKHEETGLLITPHRPEEIVSAVKRLLKEPELANRMKDNARQLILNNFSREASAKAFSDLFDSLLHSK